MKHVALLCHVSGVASSLPSAGGAAEMPDLGSPLGACFFSSSCAPEQGLFP